MNSNKKLGRPTSSPLINDVKVRLDKPLMDILLKHCEEYGFNKAEGIRDAISRLQK